MALIGANQPETLLRGLGSFWQRAFSHKEQLDLLYQGAETNIAQTYLDTVSTVIRQSLRQTPLQDHVLWEFIDLSVDKFVQDPVTGYWHVPHNSGLVFARFLQNRILYPTVTLENGYDFEVDHAAGELIFYNNIHNPISSGLPSYEDDAEVMHIGLWVQDAAVDNLDLYTRFGKLFSLDKSQSTEEFYQLIKAIWSLYTLGPTIEFIEGSLNLMAGLPVGDAIEGEEITAVDLVYPGGPLVTTDLGNRYVFPPGTVLKAGIIPGAPISLFEPLTETFTVTDYVKDATWWEDQVIPYQMFTNGSLTQRRSRAAWYAMIFGGPDETISAWTDITATDFATAFLVVPNDLLWIGEPGFEEPFTITSVNTDPDGHVLRFTPNLDEDYIDNGRFSIGSAANPTLRKPIATNGRSLRVGGTYYGQLDTYYGGNWHHNLAWNLWFYLLKYHVFMVLFDDSALTAPEISLFVDVILQAKPSYVLPVIAPWSEFTDTLNPDDDLLITVGLPGFTELVVADDPTWVYNSDELYNDPMIYYGMMDRDFLVGATVANTTTDVVAPAQPESILSGTIVARYTNYLPFNANTVYPLIDGVISGGVINGWELFNSSALNNLDEVLNTHLQWVTKPTVSTFKNAVRTAPYITLLTDNPTQLTLRIDTSSFLAVTGFGLGIFFIEPANKDNWVGAFQRYDATGNCLIESLNTLAGVTAVTGTLNLGAAVSDLQLKIERNYPAYGDLLVYGRRLDADPWTLISTVNNANMTNDTMVGVVVYNDAGITKTVNVLNLDLLVRVS